MLKNLLLVLTLPFFMVSCIGSSPNLSLRRQPNYKIKLSWDANREAAVNRSGGGYRIYYGTTAQLDVSKANFKEVPFESGESAPTNVEISNLPAGTYYVKVVAYSSLGENGGVKLSEPSSEVSLSVP